ncbi:MULTISPECIES: electron transfer flavoprotein subunit beta/FixA family protein [Leeuwenhoekiella]|jgi:electron transfer flavoprotein beta subunit|uniref:electron transfer flavoprotein subunit beta/FixA family protein n=1 Tax=Leeuwenhoekiella TaxID=283735 RepID=UPI000C6A2FF7|nr:MULTISPECIES: electron transfer flavoprotein subunit beta/FixA family protein [Leeuwenhoekiella]MAO42539.1 electron transfer flavoprotein subunit alpha [Leeuwenhoekiella sp.]MBQ52733.1 electron transfer flavoprotein subunit alpha [Leeuwenhoekiella sp.]HBT10471.1 electron transfer flavoprotein subunit alpha [Leeuwenhoekiella sp.]HCW63918.1 electron transfer flavoprotein subunit alpha [Leeuwenhoekiella sp.]|tara:strand:+ start:6225 stop:6971 length:747 start_codon:yes stop_codon:yes gene_type:complete
MKILVCISHVPDTTSKINFTDNDTKFDTNGVQFVINPNDEFGLTRAMWFKEKQGATVDIINVGGPETEPTLRKALAIGADSAIRINTEALDGFQVAKELSAIAKEGNYDLIIAGRESIDYNGGMVPGMLASLLGASFVNTCISLEVDGDTATAVREIDGGKETVTAKLPLVVGGQKGIVEESDLRIPNMRGIMMARKKPLEVKEPQGASTETSAVSFEKPAPKGDVKLISPDNLDELIDLLHNEAKAI